MSSSRSTGAHRWLPLGGALVALASLAEPAHAHPRTPEPRGRLDALVAEMIPPGHDAPGHLYARAFAGYALVDVGLADPSLTADSRRRLDELIARVTLSSSLVEAYRAGHVTVAGHRLSASVALRGHLALLLVGRTLLGAMPPGEARLRDELVDGLSDEVLASSTHLLPSYAGGRVWPADNEVLRAALTIYVRRIRDVEHVHHALDAITASLDGLERDRLPPSELAPGTLVARDIPRGCALSWTVAMRSLCDAPSARRLYTRYRAAFLVDLGPVHGFREWPPGVDRAPDADSGPIILGIGVAASGIGLGAVHSLGLVSDWEELRRSASWAGMEWIQSGRVHVPWAARAMAYWAETARPWCD